MERNTNEIKNAYDKSILVIESCTNLDQLVGAKKYIDMFEILYYDILYSGFNISQSSINLREACLNGIREKYREKHSTLKHEKKQ